MNVIPASTQATDKDQREAIDELRFLREADTATQQRAATITLEALERLGIEELQALAKGHKLGVNVTGWVNPYPLSDPRSVLLQYQDRVASDRSRFKCTLQARQTGKDFTLQEEVAQDCYETPNNSWMIAAPSERQSLDSLDQCKLWCRAWAMRIEDYQEKREGDGSEKQLLRAAEIKLPNGSKVVAVPGRPDTVRGKSASVGVTEVDFLENPKETVRALLPSITNPLRGGEKKLRYISTPNGVGNLMHKTRTQPGGKMAWSHHTTNLLQAVLMGLPVDWEALVEAFGDDHEGVRQELWCEFLDGSNVLLPYDLIQASESMEASEVWDVEQALNLHGPTFAGIDFGRQNDPTVCWTLQRVGNCLWTREVLVLEKVSTPEQEQILRSRVAAANRVSFDYTGPGIGLGDYLAAAHGQHDPTAHKFGKVELCTFTAGFKRELFPRLRRAFEASMPGASTIGMGAKVLPIRIPVSTVIREDLHQVQQVLSGGQYNYWSPRTRNGHSDRCTALALAVRAAGEGGGTFGYDSIPRNERREGGSRTRKGGRWGI